jgi:hypothetical protein
MSGYTRLKVAVVGTSNSIASALYSILAAAELEHADKLRSLDVHQPIPIA